MRIIADSFYFENFLSSLFLCVWMNTSRRSFLGGFYGINFKLYKSASKLVELRKKEKKLLILKLDRVGPVPEPPLDSSTTLSEKSDV